MKKVFTLLVTVSLGLSLILTGCGSQATNKSTSENKQATSQTSNETTPIKISEFKYYTAEQLKDGIEKKSPLQLVDIQVTDEYNDHHIKGVVPTYAYPVKTDEEKAKLAEVIPQLKDSKEPIVIVCPGGAGGAERAYQYFYEQGIDESRLFILQKGQKGWPYDELLEK